MEVIDAPSNFEVVKELADVLAVLKGIANFNGFDWEVVLEYAEIKEKASGPFTVGMVWDRTITKDEDGS